MINRCRPGNIQNNSTTYRNITVCKRWEDFANFLADMKVKPQGMTLDRIDNSKGYSQENCRWATYAEQNRNHSRNVFITYDGVTKCRKDWAHGIGISYQSLQKRIDKGWPLERALFEPKKT